MNTDRADPGEQRPTKQRRLLDNSPSISFRTSHSQTPDTARILSHSDYTIGWICALPKELSASKAALDEVHCSLPNQNQDTNTYTLGAIHGHNIVMACLPSSAYGTSRAATTANDMKRSYPSLRIYLLVGIGGGVPGQADIRLGDIVVGHAVVQHDLGRATGLGQLELVGSSWEPPSVVMTAISQLRANHGNQPSQIPSILEEMHQRFPSSTAWASSSDQLNDCLYDSNCEHVTSNGSCDDCDDSMRIKRARRPDKIPHIHYGTIASGNQVIKHAKERDTLVRTLRDYYTALPPLLCVEMEAAGLKATPHLVIRGICDYADSHKNDQWQPFAAAVAAAYAKELLSVIPSIEVRETNPIADIVRKEIAPERRASLLASLVFKDIASRIDNIESAYATTCRWLLQDPGYLDWLNPQKLEEHHGFLWIKGKPGAGKSTMMKFLVGNASQGSIIRNATVIVFFFNARGDELEKSTMGMYRSLLYQLLRKFPEAQSVLSDVPEETDEDDGRHRWNLPLLRKLLSRTLVKLHQRPLVFFIDALDECHEDQVREMIEDFEKFSTDAYQSAAKFYVCLSSRHYPFIDLENGVELVLEDKTGHTQDLEKYVQSKLGFSKSKEVQNTICDIIEKASGVFLWVVLVVQILKKEIGKGQIHKIKAKVKELPRNLSDLFRRILRRDDEDKDWLLVCLQWVCFSKRPLRPEEFYFAVMSALASDRLSKWDTEAMPLEDIKRFVLGTSKGLIEVSESRINPTVQFIHESVRDFLLRDHGLLELFPELGLGLDSICQNQLKSCCQMYLETIAPDCTDLDANFTPGQSAFSSMSLKWHGARRQIPIDYPFVDYAVEFILDHADSAAESLNQNDFLQQFDKRYWINLHNALGSFRVQKYAQSSNLIHILVHEDLPKLLSEAIHFDESQDQDQLSTLIFHAASQGMADVVRVLLDGSVHVECRDETGRTILHCAAYGGYNRMIEILVAKGANIEAIDEEECTPLIRASMQGLERTVKLLIEKGANIQAEDRHGNTALYAAIKNQHESVARMLLKMTLSGNVHPLALIEAVKNNSIDLCRLLIDKDVDVNTRGGRHGNALQTASWRGNIGIMKLLLNHGADVNSQCGYYGNALHAALDDWNNEIAILLIERGADVNAPGEKYPTALQAVRMSFQKESDDKAALVEILLEKGAKE